MARQRSMPARIVRGLRRAGAFVLRTYGPGLLTGAAGLVLIGGAIVLSNDVARSVARSHPGADGIALGMLAGGAITAALALLSSALEEGEFTRTDMLQTWGQFFFLGMYFCSQSTLSGRIASSGDWLDISVMMCPLFLVFLWNRYGPRGSAHKAPAT